MSVRDSGTNKWLSRVPGMVRADSNRSSNNALWLSTSAAGTKKNVQSRLAITRLAITRIGYNAVGRGPRMSATRGEMGATAKNNAVINCHLFL